MAPPHLTQDSTAGDLRTWLKVNNFEKWIPAFEYYSGIIDISLILLTLTCYYWYYSLLLTLLIIIN